MTKVHGKRYAYKFDFQGLAAATQPASEHAYKYQSDLFMAPYHHGGKLSSFMSPHHGMTTSSGKYNWRILTLGDWHWENAKICSSHPFIPKWMWRMVFISLSFQNFRPVARAGRLVYSRGASRRKFSDIPHFLHISHFSVTFSLFLPGRILPLQVVLHSQSFCPAAVCHPPPVILSPLCEWMIEVTIAPSLSAAVMSMSYKKTFHPDCSFPISITSSLLG